MNSLASLICLAPSQLLP